MSKVMDVIVIGCGASGLAALRRLHDAGLKVMGLEAAERLGGRVCSETFGESVVDIGAAWCHGEKDNIVFELANPLNLLGRPAKKETLFLRPSGEVVDCGEILKALDDAVNAADKTGEASIEECVRNKAQTDSTLRQNPTLTASLVEWFTRNNHLGGQNDPKEGKSLKGLAESWPCDGEFMLNWKGRGFKTILDVLMNRYPDPSKEISVPIFKKKEVVSIKWKSSEAGFEDGTLVHMKCGDGSLYAARSVLVTLPVGVLKERHENLFNPQLSKEKITALNTLQMCVLDKIYVEFTKPWWPETLGSYNIIWTEEDKQLFAEENKWITEIYGFLTVDYQPNVLLTWIYGEGAKMMEKLSEDEVKKGVEKLLDVMFRKQFKVTPIKAILRTKWATNRFARGAYAYRSVATEQNGGYAAQTLSEPLHHKDFPVVCFGGEATSIHRHGAVHGAIEAGFREADRLIDCFKRLK